jgi:hypothetical protein
MSLGLVTSRADARSDPLTAGEEFLSYAGRQDAMTITGELAAVLRPCDCDAPGLASAVARYVDGARAQGVALARILTLLDALILRHARGTRALAASDAAAALSAFVRRRAVSDYARGE